MNVQNIFLNLIVFNLPTIAIIYVIVGIRLIRQKVDGQFNFFSPLMFASAVYGIGYFFSLNSPNIDLLLIARDVMNLGVVFIPTFGILFMTQFVKISCPRSTKILLHGISSLLWVVYITNPIHHWAFKKVELLSVNGFSVASTTKYVGYYLILAYYGVFLVFSIIVLLKALKKEKSENLKKSFRFILASLQVSWLSILIILTGFDKYVDPTPIVILFLSVLIALNEVKTDLFEFEINRWKQTFFNMNEVAFLINQYNEVVGKNEKARLFFEKNEKSLPELLKNLERAVARRKPVRIRIGDDVRWFYVNSNEFNVKRMLTSFMLVDFTHRHQVEVALRESEEKHRLLITQMSQGLAVHEIIQDEAGKVVDFRYLDANESYERLTGLSRTEIIGQRASVIRPQLDKKWIERYGQVAMTGKPFYFEDYSDELDKYFDMVVYSPRYKQFAMIISDVTERKLAEREISYLSYHDYLTGLNNRRYYEEELMRLDTPQNLPITMIMADVNGLKLINDSFGHAMGDELLKKAARLIQEASPKGSLVARLGGDEFVIVLPQTDIFQGVDIINLMKEKTGHEKIGAFDISISYGYETKELQEQNIQEIYKRAEDDMYRHKLYESASIKSKTIELIMNTLYEKSSREMQHSRRVGDLCRLIASEMQLEKDTINQIGVAGLMHDIGKMGIDETILNKEGKLNFEEWMEIQRHPEIGYRILSSANEFSEMSRHVFEHHERWDGKGYPKKLKGEEISLQARIIGVADAYDAMTCDRSYRKGLSEMEAINELRRCAGSQFDPMIVSVLIDKVLKRNDQENP
jgi:diguanylate cyclase (GGDEF)-like protein/PAS domain S-box-containing protein